MSAQLETIKKLAATAKAAQPWEVKQALTDLFAAIIEWMEREEHGDRTNSQDR